MIRALSKPVALLALLTAVWPPAPVEGEPAYAQPAPSSLFVDRVDVDVINVEVFVGRRDGRRVKGLAPEDFEIYEDSQRVEISNFYAVAGADRLGQDYGRKPAGDGPSERSGAPEDQQLNLMVYVDHYNLRPRSQARILDQLEAFLADRAAHGDNVMLVGFDRRIKVVQSFTRDREKIAQGLATLRKVATHGQIDDLERRRVQRRMAQLSRSAGRGYPSRMPGGADMAVVNQLIRSYVERVRTDLRYTLDALQKTAGSLAGLPGRKAILYVSDGLPKRPGEALYLQMQELFGTPDPMLEALGQDQTYLLERIARQANAHQVTLYPLDARGLDSGTMSAEYADPNGGLALDSARKINLQEPLIQLAEATGGAPILNTQAFERALDDIARDFDSFYSLGYRSRHGGDGKYHRIDVRVKGEALDVRHRTGFLDKPEVERIADRTLSSLILNLEKNPLGIDLDFGEPEKESRGIFLLPVLIRIPFSEITLLPNGEVEQGSLRIFLTVQDEEGGISKTHQFSYPLSVPREQVARVRGREIGYSTNLKIRRGLPKVAVGVWDELSGTESFVHKSLLVGPAR